MTIKYVMCVVSHEPYHSSFGSVTLHKGPSQGHSDRFAFKNPVLLLVNSRACAIFAKRHPSAHLLT